MSLSAIGLLFGFFIVLCLASGIWLLLHLTAVASVFRGKADLVASPRPRHASRKRVFAALTLFTIGLAGVIVVQIGTMEGATNQIAVQQ